MVFGVSSLKFPQYFVLILLPAYCYFWTELAHWNLDLWWKRFWPIAAAIVGTHVRPAHDPGVQRQLSG